MAQLWENFDRAAHPMVRVEIGLDSAIE